MVRSGLLIAALAGAACSIPNPWFEVREDGSVGTTVGSGEQTTGAVGVSSEGAVSESGTGEPTETSMGMMGACGDGKTDPGETCDDGNVVGGDACPADCVSESCGDGVVDLLEGEACDDGNAVDDDMCTSACRLPACGDGVVQGGEACDDGDADDSDVCPGSCQLATCGDSHVQTGVELCDDGADNGGYGVCSLDCSRVRECGDGITDPEESCDDGNQVDGDGCDGCVVSTCGNAVVDPGEVCDDGNGDEEDECTSKCQPPACGDGFVQVLNKEQCDDGNAVSTDACTTKCTNAKCGDGYVWEEKEKCDDGNDSSQDACKADCTLAFCGDGVVQLGVEQCDDGNEEDGDGCTGECVLDLNMAECGNGMLEPGEECDTGQALFQNVPNVCTDACKINACFKVHNDKLSEQQEPALKSIDWLTPCVDKAGTSVFVMLVDDEQNVVYAAKGLKGAAIWETDNLTMGVVKPGNEYDVLQHQRLVALTRVVPNDAKTDWLMLTSQAALQKSPPLCHTSMGDGYGVAIFDNAKPNKFPRMLVMPAFGPNSNKERSIFGFKGSTEISYVDANSTMGACTNGVTGFSGTFYLSVF